MAWAKLDQGKVYADAVKRASGAFTTRNTHPDRMRNVLEDPSLGLILPHFGFEMQYVDVKPADRWIYKGPSQFWQRAYWPFISLWTGITNGLPGLIEHEGQEDGSIVERISTAKVEQLWRQQKESCDQGSRKSIPDAERDFYLAAILSELPGPRFLPNETGDAVVRHLPAHPYRYHIGPPQAVQLKNGLLFDVTCWVTLPPGTVDNPNGIAEIVFLSCVGSFRKLRAATAAFQDAKREIWRLVDDRDRNVSKHEHIAARRCEGKQLYKTYYPDEPLPCGLTHLIIQHYSVLQPRVGMPFLHVTGVEGVPDLRLFIDQFEIASPYPINQDWAPMLWAQGLKRNCIVRLPSRGCQGYWIRTDDPQWEKIISQCAGGDGKHISIEIVGTTSAAIIVGDRDDDNDEETSDE